MLTPIAPIAPNPAFALPDVAPRLRIADATLPLTYAAGLEYSPPARGTWTIMHLGLLIPETHVIFVCARCCLRGVSMSAAELRALDRFSTVTIEDGNLLEGDTEAALIEGVSDILGHLPRRPRGVIIYTSCVHEFIGSDLTFSFEELRRRFPDIVFTDGYMTPILRKRITPDMRNRRQIYTMIRRAPDADRDGGVTMVGDVRPMGAESDIRAVVEASGRPWRTITATRAWEDYQALGRSGTALAVNPSAKAALDWVEGRLGMRPLMLSTPWGWEENVRMLTDLCRTLGADPGPSGAGLARRERVAREMLARAREAAGETPIAIDQTATTRPLSLARLLLEEGFQVVRLYVDAALPGEREDFEALQRLKPDLELRPTIAAAMVRGRARKDAGVLAIGQKAAWFERTDRFVNMVEGDGRDGFSAVSGLAREIINALARPKSARELIQVKALGCTSGGCL